MKKLYKLVCDRCYALFRGELEEEKLALEQSDEEITGGICSICGRVEGQRTVQFSAAEIMAAANDAKGSSGKGK